MMCYAKSPYAEGYHCQLPSGHDGICLDDDDQPFMDGEIEVTWIDEE